MISGLPIEPNENLLAVIDCILNSLGLSALKDDELLRVKRIRNAKSNAIICATFRDFERKLAVLRNSSKGISLSDIRELRDGEANPRIYITTHLTPFFGNLSRLGCIAISKKLIHSGWVSWRGFSVRLNHYSDPFVIETVQHFETFLRENKRK